MGILDPWESSMCIWAAPSIILTPILVWILNAVLMAPNIPKNLICSYGALFHLIPMMGPGMTFRNKEGLRITFPRLAWYNHSGKSWTSFWMLETLEVVIHFFAETECSRGRLFLSIVSVNAIAVLLIWFTTYFWYCIFPMSSASARYSKLKNQSAQICLL